MNVAMTSSNTKPILYPEDMDVHDQAHRKICELRKILAGRPAAIRLAAELLARFDVGHDNVDALVAQYMQSDRAA